MQQRDLSVQPEKKDEALQLRYDALAEEILTSVLCRINRLIAYARSHKGQHWISEYKIDPDRLRSYFIRFEGRGQVDAGPLFWFQPPRLDFVRLTIGDDSCCVHESDWSEVRSFVAGTSKSNLIGELLAGAEQLLSNGHYRSAITEAFTALEVAVSDFANDCNADKAFAPHMAKRLALNSLKSQVKHLGISATVNYLLPTILPETLLPTSTISECDAALELRNNIVHNGQRNVQEADAKRAVGSIRTCCEILETLTAVPAESS